MGKGATSEAGKSLFRATNVWWRCTVFVPRCLEKINVCIWCMFFYVCCSDCVGVCGNVCCLAAIANDSVFCLEVLKYVVCVRGVMDIVFSVCIVTRGPVGACVWEV